MYNQSLSYQIWAVTATAKQFLPLIQTEESIFLFNVALGPNFCALTESFDLDVVTRVEFWSFRALEDRTKSG